MRTTCCGPRATASWPSTIALGARACATASDWQDVSLKLFWRTMGFLRLILGLFPMSCWVWLLRVAGVGAGPERTRIAAELACGSSVDLAQAGRELSRNDGRRGSPGSATSPAAVVPTTRDRQVRPRKQRKLAKLLEAPAFEVRAGHMAASTDPEPFHAPLMRALTVTAGARSPAHESNSR